MLKEVSLEQLNFELAAEEDDVLLGWMMWRDIGQERSRDWWGKFWA
jgi:hypothetical protein